MKPSTNMIRNNKQSIALTIMIITCIMLMNFQRIILTLSIISLMTLFLSYKYQFKLDKMWIFTTIMMKEMINLVNNVIDNDSDVNLSIENIQEID